MQAKSLLIGLLIGFGTTALGAALAGGVTVNTLDAAQTQHASGRYTLSVEPGETPVYRIFDSQTGELRVFSDKGVLLELNGRRTAEETNASAAK